jgi:hypothetical protein
LKQKTARLVIQSMKGCGAFIESSEFDWRKAEIGYSEGGDAHLLFGLFGNRNERDKRQFVREAQLGRSHRAAEARGESFASSGRT